MLAAQLSPTPTRAYARRQPEDGTLYGVVRDHLPALLERARDQSEHGFGYPRFVEREFEKFLGCGLLCNGFVRVRCDHCAEERLVAFSCKTRGFCPSCSDAFDLHALKASTEEIRIVDRSSSRTCSCRSVEHDWDQASEVQFPGLPTLLESPRQP